VIGVDEECLGVDVGEDRDGAGPDHGQGAGDEGVGGNDDLVAGAYTAGAEGDLEGVGAVGDPDAVAYSNEGGELGLECLPLVAEDEDRAIDDPRPSSTNLVGDLGVLGPQVNQRD
jgi:hypothetical protein